MLSMLLETSDADPFIELSSANVVVKVEANDVLNHVVFFVEEFVHNEKLLSASHLLLNQNVLLDLLLLNLKQYLSLSFYLYLLKHINYDLIINNKDK